MENQPNNGNDGNESGRQVVIRKPGERRTALGEIAATDVAQVPEALVPTPAAEDPEVVYVASSDDENDADFDEEESECSTWSGSSVSLVTEVSEADSELSSDDDDVDLDGYVADDEYEEAETVETEERTAEVSRKRSRDSSGGDEEGESKRPRAL